MRLYLNRTVLSWSFYDFANSAFATTILAVIFNVYFVKVICAGGVPVFGAIIPGESLWGYVISVAMLIVFLISPIAGAIADLTAFKKKFLFIFTTLGCLATALLFFCREGDFWLAAAAFILADVGFSTSMVFYNALLNDISTPETVGRISGFGWAVGYIGGGLLLALNLAMIQKPGWFGLSTKNYLPTRTAILSVAFWWGIFSVPIFLWVDEKKSQNQLTKDVVVSAFKNIVETFHRIRQLKEIFKYLIANLIYNDAIETVILMASVFGAQSLGMSQGDLILCFLMIQGVGFFGAMLFGYLADRFAHKSAISLTLVIYMAVCLWAAVMKTKTEFWILGAVVGTVLGGSQAASRSLLALLVPPENSTQFFGFFALTQELSTVIGPFIFALVAQIYSLRAAVGSLAIIFAAGLVLLQFVREPERKFLANY